MKTRIYILYSVIAVIFTACTSVPDDRTRKTEAEQTTQRIIACLTSQQIDSLPAITANHSDIAYYIFNGLELVYWSDDRLNIDSYTWSDLGAWQQCNLTNADVLARWERWGHIRVLAVVPISWSKAEDSLLADTFSYLPLQHTATPKPLSTAVIIIIVFSLAVLIFCLYALFRLLHGQPSIRLNLLAVLLLLATAGVILTANLAGRYSDRRYADRQLGLLHDKCLYIQAALQNIYYWELQLPQSLNKDGAMDIELHDLAHTYGLDINAYDVQGRLIGTSTRELVNSGFVSPYFAPDILFSQALAQSDGALVETKHIDTTPCLVAYAPFLNGQNVQIGYISVPLVLSEEESEEEKNTLLLRLLPACVLLLLMAFALSICLKKYVFRPLTLLAGKMSRYRFGRKDNGIQYTRRDEIGTLAAEYNSMVASLDDTFRRLISTERDSAWRTMARQIAHEINNPLTPMKLSIQQLRRTKGTDRFDDYFDRSTSMLLEQMDTLSRIASSFSTFAKMPDVAASEVDIAQKLTAAISLFADNEQHIPVRYVGANSGVMAWADSEQILEVFTNIIKNALQALEGISNGDIIVMLKDGEEEVCITISDNGHGINEDIRDRIFTPNFTTKSTGTGLGLAISKNIVEGSEGRISFETSQKGTKFFVYLKKTP